MLVVDNPDTIHMLEATYGEHFRRDVSLAPYTSARVGGPARFLVTVNNRDELANSISLARRGGMPFFILGGGSNILVSDLGFSGLVILNKARLVKFIEHPEEPEIWAESGANLGLVSRQAATRGLAGLAWAAGIPGTVGGAVAGNAGAHGSDMAKSLLMAEILQHRGTREDWSVEELKFAYRSSKLKRIPGENFVLSAALRVENQPPEKITAEMDEFLAYRRRTQPPGASMGSMFKNPPGDFAGRLIESAGLKGERIGDAQISLLHGNFFINHGGATGQQVRDLISYVARVVEEKYGVELELEIELIGEWPEDGIC